MSIVRGCDSCNKAIPGMNWWTIRMRDQKSKSSTGYDLCDSCRKKLMEHLGFRKTKEPVMPIEEET